ncbi:MAG TPA: nucleotidyl transferase [Anaerolineae bacterium]|nr:nucleotidyl transferase [Anaerolineae bacterium]
MDLFPKLLARGDSLFGYVAKGYWCDIGNISEYQRATADLLRGKVRVQALGRYLGNGVWTGDDVEIALDAELYGPIYLGHGVKIRSGAVIQGPSVIRDYTIVDDRAHIDRSIIWRNSYIGEGVELRGAIAGRQCNLRAGAVIFEGAVIGDQCVIGEDAIVRSNVKLWPNKEVEPGATVTSSIIWGSQGRRSLFGRFGVTGVVNVDLTPEFAAKLGATFAATLPMGSIVCMNRDPHRSPRMLKRAIISGLPSGGVNVWDLGTVPIPVARYYTRTTKAAACVHVRLSPYDPRVVDIRFMNQDGLNLSKSEEREIERLFFREDIRRAYMDDIGTISYAPQVVERYTKGFLAALNVEAIRQARLRMVIDYAHSPNVNVLPDLLTALNVDVVPLNAHVDESKISMTEEQFQAQRRQLALIVGVLGTDLGVQLDVGGEKLFVVDDKGRVLSDEIACALMAEFTLRAHGGGTIAVPVDMPSVFEQLAERYGGQVLRTPVDLHGLMEAAKGPGVVMAGDGHGSFIFPDFQPAVDGLMATAKLLEFLTRQRIHLSDVVDNLPPYHMARSHASCAWPKKGQVMRLINEQYQDICVEVPGGIKFHIAKTQWVLIRPDPERPLFHITAEGATEQDAQALVSRYVQLIQELQD